MTTNYPNWLFQKTRIFHMTSIKNISSIIENGILAKNKLQNINFKNAAYENIQDKRHHIKVNVQNTLHDYVPFHFAPRSPMLFAIADGKVAGCNQEEMVYLVSYAEKFANECFAFCDIHPIMQPVNWYYDLNNLNKLPWEIFFEPPLCGEYSKFWQDRLDNPKWANRKAKRQAEFLVYDKVELSKVVWFAVKNESMKLKLSNLLTAKDVNLEIKVVQEWYK